MRRTIWVGVCLLALIGQTQAQTNAATTAEGPTISSAEIRELLDAAKATAKATRDNVDYARTVPDILFQILTKLDKIEDKLDKVENAVKRNQAIRTNSR
jgi:hypothetical protein